MKQRKAKQVRTYILNESGCCVEAGCNSCGRILPVEQFAKASKKKHGINSICKDCANAYRKAHREENNRDSKKSREKQKHDPLVYLIDFGNGYCYIGQSNNCTDRMVKHKNEKRILRDKSQTAINLFMADKKAWRKSVDNHEIVKRFPEAHDFEITDFEYELQLKVLKEGKKLLGKQYSDMAFKLWLKIKLGKDEALRIIELSRSINEQGEV